METLTRSLNEQKLLRKPGLFEKFCLKALTSLPKGRLTLTLPSGEVHHIGDGSGQISADITIVNKDFFYKGAMYGDIGFAEAYMDGDWETTDITAVISFFILNLEHASFMSGSKVKQLTVNMFRWLNKVYHAGRKNTLLGSKKNIAEHYDLGNDFYSLWLDKSMTYSSARFTSPDMSLEEAQYQKYDRLCQALQLKPTDKVLEIGSGWGSNAIHIAKYYGCTVDTVTISEEQYKYALQRVKEENLSHRVNVHLKDYRLIEGSYDKIVSIEMLEAVGAKYLDTYFAKCTSLLNKNGMLGLQVITCADSRFEELKRNVDFIQKHIFPGSLLPSVAAINKAVNKAGNLNLVDLVDFGQDYAKTLNIWHKNFNSKLTEVKKLGYSEKFIRKWNYYLCYCEAAFAMKNIFLMQLVYSKPNNILNSQ